MKPVLLVVAGPNGAGAGCARTEDALLRKIYIALPEWVSDGVSALQRHPQFIDLRAA